MVDRGAPAFVRGLRCRAAGKVDTGSLGEPNRPEHRASLPTSRSFPSQGCFGTVLFTPPAPRRRETDGIVRALAFACDDAASQQS